MLKNFFKIAFRNLWRHKGFSALNIGGLAIGMASAILILLWIQNELSFDRFHTSQDRLYVAWNRSVFDGKLQCWPTTPRILGPTLKTDYPEVEKTSRIDWTQTKLFSIGDKRLTVPGTLADPDFLTMFSFPLVKGNIKTALEGVYSIVLTEKLAKKLYGSEDPMGKVIKIDNKDNFTVTGVLKDLPNNTRFDFEYLLPWEYNRVKYGNDSSWDNNSTRTYVLLKPHTSIASFNEKIKGITIKHLNGRDKIEVFLYDFGKMRLYSNFENGKPAGGRITVVKVFALIAAFILLIACINFMNLSTARSEKRAKEVGLRKVVGAKKGSLIAQFLGESVLIAFLAGILAVMAVQLSLHAFNQLTKKELVIEYGNIYFWFASIAFVILTGVIAGSYPAFFLSAFKPVAVLKGGFKKINALITPRKLLVVLQFTIAIALIICTIIIERQIKYAQERETGYARNNLAYVFLQGDLDKNYKLVKEELLSSGDAVAVTKTSAPLTQGWSDSWGFDWEGKDPNAKLDFDQFCTDGDLIKTSGMKLLQGRDFDINTYVTDSMAIILNESAVKIMNFKDPVGKTVKNGADQYHVIGVIKDFILQSPYEPTRPMIIRGPKGWFNVIHIKLNDKHTTAQNLAGAEKIFKKYNPQYPFEYRFVDEEYARKFSDEKTTGTLAALFAGLTILISCLGLFGLATYMAETRIKEIGVRKVLGASVTTIATLLSKDFIKLVIVSIAIASPVAWWSMSKWLQTYNYRVNMSWWIFLEAGLLAILIALMTVSFQAIKAAVANPVKSLRTE